MVTASGWAEAPRVRASAAMNMGEPPVSIRRRK